MDSALGFLFAAFFVTWLGLLLYLVTLSGRIKGLEREVEALKDERAEDHHSARDAGP